MSMGLNQKLELTWIGKDKQIRVEPRILLYDEERSYGDKNEDNKLIHGDNMIALKALEQQYAGKIKCIYIDPPYNTGSAFDHYDDNLEHSTWLSLMSKRLELLKELLSEDGSIWISIDDDEQAYLKVLCDEIFGRKNFISCVIWEKKYTVANDAKWLSDNHDYILVYAKNKEIWRPNLLPRTPEMNKAYKNPDNHPKGPWKATPLHAKSGSAQSADFVYIFKNGVEFRPPKGTFSRYSKETLKRMDDNDEIWFGKNGTAIPSRKTFLCDLKNSGVPSKTLWRFDEVGHNHEAREEVKVFNSENVFATPKPERLIHRIIELATKKGDIVLDSFLGSGTTAAVAHKMGRKWIGIELGEHCYTHCIPRLKAVVKGEQGGISKSIDWKGGGGFKFYELAPSLLKQDKYGNWVINTDTYTATLVAVAVAKYHGFTYYPDEEVFWKQGYSYEKDYIFTTDQMITVEYIDLLHSEMKDDESLLICCPAYQQGIEERYENIDIEKIPQSILDKYDFGVENYSMNINDTTVAEVATTIDEEE